MMNGGKRKTNMTSAALERTLPLLPSMATSELTAKRAHDSDGQSSIFPDNFFRKQGTGAEFFDETVRNVLDAYESGPGAFSPVEELLILKKMSLGATFSHVGIADVDGAYRVEDQFLRIAHDEDFPFRSELGRRFARYKAEVAAQQYRAVDFGVYDTKPLIEYDGDVQIMTEYLADLSIGKEDNIAGTTGDTELQKAYLTFVNSAEFRSFISKTLSYNKRSFGQEFPVGLFAKFLLLSDPEQFKRCENVAKHVPESLRATFLESFLATEHGNQLGESILEIAEKCQDHENAAEVFRRIKSIRSNMDDWKSVAWFADADSGYSDYFAGIRQGIEMRIAQILSPAPELIDNIPQKAQYFHRDGTIADVAYIASFDQMIQGLKIIEIMTTKIAAAEVASKDSRTASVGNNFFSTRTPVGWSSVRMMMRPHHSNDAEARIRWSVEITPAEQLEIFGEYLEMNKLGEPRSVRASLKLDLEKISDRVSLDLGTRVQYGSEMREYPDRLMAALVTTGVQHDLRKQGKDITHVDYHVRDPFSDKLSDPRHFASFVEAMQRQYVDRYVLELGNVTMKATDVATSPEVSKLDVVYTGLFFDDEALRQIADLFPAKYQNTPKNPHITIKFRPIDGLDSCKPGVSHTVKVVGVVDNGQAQTLLVESDATEGVMNPHITISTGNNEAGKAIPPSYAKQAIKESLMRGAVTFLDKPVELTGISGYWDGKTGKAVLSAA